MTRSGAKRTLEELANKSDSDDYDYSDHPLRSSRPAPPKSNKKKKAKPTKKRRRQDSDDNMESDDVLSDPDDLSLPDSDVHDDDNVERNARGLARRRAARNRPMYKEDDSSSQENVVEEEAEEKDKDAKPAPRTKGSTVITLKIGKGTKRQPTPEIFHTTRRSTRHNRASSEDIYALTNSGRHVLTVERGTRSPEAQPYRPSRGIKGLPVKTIEEEENPAHDKPDEDEHEVSGGVPKASQLEILESDPQGDFEEGSPPATGVGGGDPNANIEIGDEGVVPESDNGAAKDSEEDNEDDDEEDGDDEDDQGPTRRRRSRHDRLQSAEGAEPQDDDGSRPRRSSRKKPARSSQRKREDDGSDFEPNEEESEDDDLPGSQKSNGSPPKRIQVHDEDDVSSNERRSGLRKRKSQSRVRGDSEAVGDIAEELAEELENLKGDRPRRRPPPEIIYENKPRRSRKDVDYRIIRPDLVLPIEDADIESAESPSRRGRGGGGIAWQRTLFSTQGPFGGGGPASILGPPGAPGATAGVESDSSDDENMQNPKSAGPIGMSAAATVGGGLGIVASAHGADALQGPSGTPANFGRIKDRQALADSDPLGIDPNVNFDSVGGLQGHIDQLKEMVSLPLLYPEVFQRFHIVPPRGVLFHGPPGTGKTLLARALASSVSSEGRKVTFYMRKGADALSKWVGEAERQLRLLFEEARKTQPSIIFFDEMDGLAPVRSSKQEQIHASIVSTLLALMDGMDGRGQVIVIGATNRPDSIDPALRRPGRFDREFYFPLPNKEGRRAILDIHTRGWDPPLPEDIKDHLAEATKGYGGADIRALCTEAALNAVQRKYPQIYKSTQKLLIDPKKIEVTPKDFMISIKKIVPSSERSVSSGASPLPRTIEPLLRHHFVEIKKLLADILPQKNQITALEEAQFEDADEGGSFRKEQMQQEFETSRVFRPRLLIRGAQGMGQHYLMAAILHHFEGFHVQSFDPAMLLSDSAKSPEATVIQLFTEAKRHKPSVVYIPNVQNWFETVGQTVILTFLGLLRSVTPTDPILLLGILEEDGETDPEMLRSFFGFSKKNLYGLRPPERPWRHEFFMALIEYLKASPADFPDPENRKKRKLETLEIAPPPPSKPSPPLTKAQLKAQKKKDHQTLNLLKIRIQPIMDQIKKYKRFRTGVIDESQIRYLFEEDDPQIVTSDLPLEQRTTFRPFEKGFDKHGVPGLQETVSGKFYYNLEIVTVEKRLSNGYYKRPKDFVADIKRLAKDAHQLGDQERILRANELVSNVEVDIATIEQTDPALVAECENVYLRELEREKAATETTKRAEVDGGVMAPPAPTNVPHGNTDSSVSTGPVILGQPFSNGKPNVPPNVPTQGVIPSMPSTASYMTNGFHHGGGSGSDLNEGGAHTASNGSHASRADGDGDTYMTNSVEGDSGGRDTVNSSFGPSAQPKPLFSHTAPSQQIRRQSGLSSLSQKGPMTPMAPGSQPGDYANDASTTQTTSDKQSSGPQQQASGPHTEYPDLTSYPDKLSMDEHIPDTQPDDRRSSQATALTSSLEFYSQNSVPNGSQSQPKLPPQHGQQQPRVPLFDMHAKQSPHQHTNIQSLLNKEDAPPTLVVDPQYIEKLHQQLAEQTVGCSVEQLVQINAHLMDCLWKMRREWNRTRVAITVKDAFNEVLDDVLSTQLQKTAG